MEALNRIVGFRAPAPGSCVLDFGCGHGRWLNTFAEFGWTTFGIDPALKTAFTRHSELTAVGDWPGSSSSWRATSSNTCRIPAAF